ncbi:testis-expressed protein 12-like [Acanthopagrus latus]|uniref:testis-expressed protein 12-like n=1 Tax=Acanthopagrus latus TaxID=8177 RepID=UPI00187BE933|nr:testis-expressed protein 12-like [Acanthopagrus latus]
MKEATAMAGKLTTPEFKRRVVSNNEGHKKTTSQEMEHALANQDKSPPKKKKSPSKPSTVESADLFEASTAGFNCCGEVHMLLSTFVEVLSERAAADTSKMKKLEVNLAEARNLESYLKEKKNHLRQTLALISDKLQG